MLILRESSPRAIGATSDDGFEIGQVTLGGSLNLAVLMTTAGALVGVAYVAVRTALHPAARVPLAALFGAAAGGSAFVNPDGIDLRILDPLWLGVGAFIVLPGLAALCTALIVEHIGRRGPRVLPPARRRRAVAVQGVVTVVAIVLIVLASLDLADKVAQVT
jgi:hypothetical protein